MNRTSIISDFSIDETYLWRRVNSVERLAKATKQADIDYVLNRRASYEARRANLKLPAVTDWTKLPKVNASYLSKNFLIYTVDGKKFCYGPYRNFDYAREFSKHFFKADWERRLGHSVRINHGDGLNVYTLPDHEIATGWTFARIKHPYLSLLWNPTPPPAFWSLNV